MKLNRMMACATAALLLAGTATAQNSASGSLRSFKPMTDKGDYVLQMAGGDLIITPVTNDIIRVTTRPTGVEMLEMPSKTVVLEAGDENVDVNTAITPEQFELITPTTRVVVDRNSGLVTFYNSDGQMLLREAQGVDNRNDKRRVTFTSDPKEYFYGAGERGHSLKLNGDSLPMFNRQNYGYTGSDPRIRQMNITVPYFASTKGYGVLFDDYNMADLVLGNIIEYSSDTPKPLTYYFINGDNNLAGATSNYTKLTGRQDMPPFWAMGYITSKYGYHNHQETLGAIDSLKNDGYPVDGIVLDLYWYGEETDMGKLAWDPEQFPNHKEMIQKLHDQGVKIVTISQPYINKKGAIDNYNMLKANDMLTRDADGNTHDVTIWVGESGMFDVSNPKTREWYWNRYHQLTEDGVDGWWGDLGEPEVHPLTIVHDNGETASQYHNVYGNEWSRIIYEGWREAYPDRRPLLLMRGGTAGLQRYSVFPWSTDVSRSWGGYQPQVNIMLNSGLSGLGYMSSDLGGFAVDPADPYDPELYVRWVEMGAFTPTFRTHAQFKPEPYHYPQYKKQLLNIVKGRYEWLPYNYTLAYENASQGLPLARPLNFYGGDDAKYADVQDEYLWGSEVLVAPVLEKGARSRKVLFPEGSQWYSWHNPALKYAGGSTATVKAPLGQLPLFIKAGSFIPQYMQPIENTDQYDLQYLTVKYFPSTQESKYVLFDDDRKNPNSLSDNKYMLTTFSGSHVGSATEIQIVTTGNSDNNWMPAARQMTIEMVDQTRQPKSITIESNGKEQTINPLTPATGRMYGQPDFTGWYYDKGTKQVNITFPYDNSNAKLIVKY